MTDCQRYGHAIAITYGWRIRRRWLRKVRWLRCWDCDLQIEEP